MEQLTRFFVIEIKNKGEKIMKKNWSELSSAEKKLFVLLCIYVVIGLVFVALDLSGVWKNEISRYMLAIFCLVEGVVEWKKNWKMSLVNFALAILFLLNAFAI